MIMTRVLRLVGMLVISWVVMTSTHEIGHLAGGWLAGATLIDFDLAPWRLPYSLHRSDPHPLLTLWAGPLLGAIVPCLVAVAIRRQWAWFVADFCLLANGCYLALSWVSGDQHLDAPRLLSAGSPPILLALYCLLTIGVGYTRFRANCASCLRSPIETSTEPERDSLSSGTNSSDSHDPSE